VEATRLLPADADAAAAMGAVSARVTVTPLPGGWATARRRADDDDAERGLDDPAAPSTLAGGVLVRRARATPDEPSSCVAVPPSAATGDRMGDDRSAASADTAENSLRSASAAASASAVDVVDSAGSAAGAAGAAPVTIWLGTGRRGECRVAMAARK